MNQQFLQPQQHNIIQKIAKAISNAIIAFLLAASFVSQLPDLLNFIKQINFYVAITVLSVIAIIIFVAYSAGGLENIVLAICLFFYSNVQSLACLTLGAIIIFGFSFLFVNTSSSISDSPTTTPAASLSTHTPSPTQTPPETPNPSPTAGSMQIEVLCPEKANLSLGYQNRGISESSILMSAQYDSRILTPNMIRVQDTDIDQEIVFCDRSYQQSKIIATQSEQNQNNPDMVIFALDKPTPAQKIWVVINADHTSDQLHDFTESDQYEAAVVRVTFQRGAIRYDREFPLQLGKELVDWVAESDRFFHHFDPQYVGPIWQGRDSTDTRAKQVMALHIKIIDPDPVVAVSIQDLSLRSFRSKDPSLDIFAVAVVPADPHSSLLSPTLSPKQATPTVRPTPLSAESFVPVCLSKAIKEPFPTYSQKELDQIVDPTLLTTNCSDSRPLSVGGVNIPIKFTFPRSGSIYETRPSSTAIERFNNAESIITIKVNPDPSIGRIHLLMSAHNLCYSSPKYGQLVGSLIVRFANGTSMPAMNLIAGSTIRQGRTSLKCPPEVLEIKDGASQPGMIVRQGNPVREGSQKYQSQPDLLLDLVTITIPDELRDAPIESIDIVDTSLVDRRANLDEYGDPFLILYAVTLERYP